MKKLAILLIIISLDSCITINTYCKHEEDEKLINTWKGFITYPGDEIQLDSFNSNNKFINNDSIIFRIR